MGRPKDEHYWNQVTEGRNGTLKCKNCGLEFKGGVSRIKAHVDRIEGKGIRICSNIDRDNDVVQNNIISSSNNSQAINAMTTLQALDPLEYLTQEDDLYSQTVSDLYSQTVSLTVSDLYPQTVSDILKNQSSRWPVSPPSVGYVTYSTQSAFAKWSTRASHHFHPAVDGTSQWLLKYILFTVPYLHAKIPGESSPQTAADPKLCGKATPQDELSVNLVLAERHRREKLNERFIILRSLVPIVTKIDKASILGDTIEYVKQLRRKIQDLEARNRQMETEMRSKFSEVTVQSTSSSSSKEQQRSGVAVMEKRKVRIVEGVTAKAKAKAVDIEVAATSVQVSIIESDALLEIECPHREGLLLDVMQMLRGVRIEVIGVQSSLNNNGVFVAELRAKVKENTTGKKVSIVEVKRALNQIIPQC